MQNEVLNELSILQTETETEGNYFLQTPQDTNISIFTWTILFYQHFWITNAEKNWPDEGKASTADTFEQKKVKKFNTWNIFENSTKQTYNQFFSNQI